MKTKIFTLFLAILASISSVNAAITVCFDPSKCSSWQNIYLWAWTSNGNLFNESWPGKAIQLDEDGWYSYTFDESITSVNIVWSNGTDQTQDLNEITKTTYFYLETCYSGVNIASTRQHLSFSIDNHRYNLDLTNQTAILESSMNIQTANIPSSVIKHSTTYTVVGIGDNAFKGCTNLESVTIPNSVTSIGSRAFYECTSLTCVTIPNSVTSIGNGAFIGCTSLTSITIPNSVTSIETDAFLVCTSLESVTISNSVTSIGQNAFYGCSSLTSIEIPNSVTSIGAAAFESCYGLTSIIIPNSVTSIGSFAFYGCSGLKSITIPNSVTSIGSFAFNSCSSLESVTIGNNVQSIQNRTFQGCTSLTSLIIGNSVASIDEYAFEGCSNLKKITILSNALVSKTYTISDNLRMIFGEQIEECVIGDEVNAIGDNAFFLCNSLKTVTIGNGITSIGKNVFSNCTSLTKVNISDLEAWCNISFSGTDSNPTKYAKHLYLNDVEIVDLVIPDGITSIGKSAFEVCSGLTSVTIPNSVTSIGSYAFRRCTGLTSVTIGNGVSSIDGGAFYYCTGLTSVTCKAINPPAIVDGYTSRAFYRVDCSQIPLYVPAGSVEAYQNADQWKDFNPILPIENAPSDIENHNIEEMLAPKLLRNGQIFILRGDKTYTITGTEVR